METSRPKTAPDYSPSMLFNQGHGLQHVKIRSLIHYVVNESLKAGAQQKLTEAMTTPEGQRIVVEGIASNGVARKKTVEWAVQESVPEHILGMILVLTSIPCTDTL